MAIYNEDQIDKMFNEYKIQAEEKLKSLKIVKDTPVITGLNGWIYEQLIQYLISEELNNAGYSNIKLITQEKLYGRVKVDLLVEEKIAIEIKTNGLFGIKDADKFINYIIEAKNHKWTYLYLTNQEKKLEYK
jgi:hypothetical protein